MRIPPAPTTYRGPQRSVILPAKMDPTPKRRMLKEKTPDVLARSHPNSCARGAKKTLKANWLPQETMRIKKPAITMSQPGENMRRNAFLFSWREYLDILGNGENLPG